MNPTMHAGKAKYLLTMAVVFCLCLIRQIIILNDFINMPHFNEMRSFLTLYDWVLILFPTFIPAVGAALSPHSKGLRAGWLVISIALLLLLLTNSDSFMLRPAAIRAMIIYVPALFLLFTALHFGFYVYKKKQSEIIRYSHSGKQ